MRLIRHIYIWATAFTVIVLTVPGHAQSASPPPLGSNEEIVKTKDGCGFVAEISRSLSRDYSNLTWGGACIDGLAMGEGRVSEGESKYTGYLPSRGWTWYGRPFGAIEYRRESESAGFSFIWNGKFATYNTLSTSKPVWNKEFSGTQYPKYSNVSDGNSTVRAATLTCVMKVEIFPECSGDPLKFSIYVVSVFDAQSKKTVDYTCPDPRSTQGCEALWAQHAGPVIERIKAFVAENEPKAEARRREIALLLATWRPSPQARQDEAANDAAKRTAQLAERAEYIAMMDKSNRAYKEQIQSIKESKAEAAAAEKAQAERSAKDRREALGILVGAIGQYQQQKTDQRQAQQEEQQRQLQAQQAQYQEQPRVGTPAAGLSRQQISTCSEEIKNKQIESQSWGGDANGVAARLGQFQKGLFEGRCAGHPEAQAYIAGANKMLGYKSEMSGGSPAVAQANSGNENIAVGRQIQNDIGSTPSSGRGKVWVGIQNQCIKFTPEESKSDTQWFSYYNGCPITLKVCDNMSGRGWGGCGYEVKPGKTTKNWEKTSNVSRNGGNFVACATTVDGKSVFFDKEARNCYYNK